MKQKLMEKMELLKIKENNEQNKKLKNETFSVDEMTSKEFHNDVGAHVEVIGLTLKNQAYWDTYRNVILYNKHIFRGSTVLNIGCGVGLLSLFAARAGASQVFAVDNSNATDYAARVVEANNYKHIIKVFKAPLKELDLPVKEVDIILCDWMGYSLLFQSQCVDVIYARDKWLKKTKGVIFPDIAKLHLAGLEDANRKFSRINWWYNVHGFDMRVLRDFALTEPCFQQVHPEYIVSTAYEIFTMNLNTITLKDLQFRSQFAINALCDGEMDGIFTYFHIAFSQAHTPTYLHADPLSPPTRWLQTVFFFDEAVKVHKGQELYGGFEMYALREDDLNVMEAGCEMFSGNPDECFQLETEMRWRLKPASMNSKENVLDDQSLIEATGNNVQFKQIAQVMKDIETAENVINKNDERLLKLDNFPSLPSIPTESFEIQQKKAYTKHQSDQYANKNQWINNCQKRNNKYFKKTKQNNWHNTPTSQELNNTYIKNSKKKMKNSKV